ncbi:MAG: cyclic nucleotide-binding domain-containing protein [Actinobacteria bacterium]|nr:cyclic nucleotide-binding domain-containing protein [Actinomycetota bacterium]
MRDTDRSGLLDEVAPFSSLTRTELDLLSFIAEDSMVGRGCLVIEEGASGRKCFVIGNGRAKVWRDGEVVAELGPGQFFGEMSLLAGAPYSTTVTAETTLELFVVSPAEFDSLLSRAPSIVRKMLRERPRVYA